MEILNAGAGVLRYYVMSTMCDEDRVYDTYGNALVCVIFTQVARDRHRCHHFHVMSRINS